LFDIGFVIKISFVKSVVDSAVGIYIPLRFCYG